MWSPIKWMVPLYIPCRPAELGLLPRLRNLALEGNPLRSIRRPIIARGTPAVLEYLRDKLPSA